MALEAGQQIYDEARIKLLERLGVTPEKLNELREQRATYERAGDMPNFTKTAGRLALYEAFQSAVFGASNPLLDAIRRYFPEDKIPEAIPENSQQPIATVPDKKRGNRKPETYVDNAPQIMHLNLIKRDEKGHFVFRSLLQVGKSVMQEPKKSSKKALDNAKLYAGREALSTTAGILNEAAQQKATTMRGLLEKAMPKKMPETMWKTFYTEVIESYGDLSPQDFVRTVLLRFHNKDIVKRMVGTEAKPGRTTKEKETEKRTRPANVKPGDITPLDELTLSNSLVRPEILQKLKDILGDQDLLVVAQGHGFVCTEGNLNECLQASREQMADLRGGITPTDRERQNSAKFIGRTIRKMNGNGRGWHMIKETYPAFKFIYALISEVGHDPNKAEEIADALFPRVFWKTDAQDGFLLRGIDQ